MDFLRGVVHVERQRRQDGTLGPTKAAKSTRTVPLGQVVVDELAQHLAAHPSEGARSMLAGVAPIPANSGQVTTRYRLNRHCDRHLNPALHTVVQIRIQYQPATRDYVARRTAEERPAARSNAA